MLCAFCPRTISATSLGFCRNRPESSADNMHRARERKDQTLEKTGTLHCPDLNQSTTHKRVSEPMGFKKSQVLGTVKTRNFGAPAISVPVWVVLWHSVMAHHLLNHCFVSVFHSVEGAFGAPSRGTPEFRNGAPRDELKDGRGRACQKRQKTILTNVFWKGSGRGEL